MKGEKDEEIKKKVREKYGSVARQGSSCCGPAGADTEPSAGKLSSAIGYSADDMDAVPDGANLGLGCGNPLALAAVKEGDTVLDLGSGAGFDCFLASPLVGPSGKVIGVDMTAEMLEKARANARKGGYENVEFRLGEIENLPVADNSVDLVISNCVINLSTDKRRVFEEALRVLRPGARLMVSDIVLTKALPENIEASIEAYVGCVGGAMLLEDYLRTIGEAGFSDVRILSDKAFPAENLSSDPSAKALVEEAGISESCLGDLAATVSSIQVEAVKPLA